MPVSGWKQLFAGFPWFHGEGKYPVAAYSEFMPPPRIGLKPYGTVAGLSFEESDPFGLPVTEYEEAWELRPGLEKLAGELIGALVKLGSGRRAHAISRHKLFDNACWPPELASGAGSLGHERYVVFLPLALSRTQDDKGRVRWTFFGGSEQGPARAFWKGFFTGPGKEVPREKALQFIRRLLGDVYEEPDEKLQDLARAGFRILPRGNEAEFPYWSERPLPSWTAPFLWSGTGPVGKIKYLLTFRPFGALPASVRRAYLAGELHLLPFPGSLVFWGCIRYHALEHRLPLAMQIPMQHLMDRQENPYGIRVPQSGWLHEPRPGVAIPALHGRRLKQTYQRTHRWNRTHRHQDELDVLDEEDKVAHVLFSTAPDELGLYDKPMARNAQIWTHDHHLLLDGPNARREDIKRAALHLAEGGLFGYRFQFPAMRAGMHELYWHRPLVAYLSTETEEPTLLPDSPLGYVTAYPVDHPDPAHAVELWPRLLHRPLHKAALELFAHQPAPHWFNHNVRKILDAYQILGETPLPCSFARHLIRIPKHETLDDWLNALPREAADPDRGAWLAAELRHRIEDRGREAGVRGQEAGARKQESGVRSQGSEVRNDQAGSRRSSEALTLEHSARRSFEVDYWNTIAALAEGQLINKDNADCVLDKVTQTRLQHHHRDLEPLGDYLMQYYDRAISRAGLQGAAWAGEHAFTWRTDFDFSWWGGWINNQSGHAYERNIVCRIPGRDPGQAVIMADHYDTAYMEDAFGEKERGRGPRLSAAGADDNHSATAALMLAAPIFLELSKAGRLACDIWLVHLTGEEFPSDCLGARHLTQDLVQGTLKVQTSRGDVLDLSRSRVKGVYVSDMIAHNNDHDRDIFQIAPGTGHESAWLALQAHFANQIWNDCALAGNRRPPRKTAGPGRRSADAKTLPELAAFLPLHGEIRPQHSPHSTLYNTDGQIFSDAGIPVVLFMENYDINRTGYHDTHDTMANIDLDYGSALAAIVIETVARAASM
jgi:hypothetical protein